MNESELTQRAVWNIYVEEMKIIKNPMTYSLGRSIQW